MNTMLVIPIIDCSGSMQGIRISAVNESMCEMCKSLMETRGEYAGVAIEIAPLTFSFGAEWVGLRDERPVPLEEFSWPDIWGYGLTDFGAALRLLLSTLPAEKGGWLRKDGSVKPIFFVMTDGHSTDPYQEFLEKLCAREWFRDAPRYGFLLSDECDADMVSAFTGSPEAVNSVTYDAAGFMDVSSLKFGKLFADRCRAYLRKLLPQ